MPILDMIVDCAPDAVHSLDPQGGVDLAEVKKLYGDKVCLIGNVNCGKMQTGTRCAPLPAAGNAGIWIHFFHF